MQRIIRSLLGPAMVFLGCLAIPANLKAEDAAEYVKESATAWLEKGEYDKAVADSDKALALNPKSAEDYSARGYAWAVKYDCDKAIADCDKALTLKPKFAEAYRNRGNAWEHKGNWDKAIADYSEAIRLDPIDAVAWYERGSAVIAKDEFDQSVADLTEAIRLNPKYAFAYCERGFAYTDKGESEKARADFERAVVLAPDNSSILNNFGVFLWKKAQDQEAKAAKAEAAGDRATAEAFRQKSAALKNDAKAQWNRGVTLNPRAADIHSNLGYAYGEANDLDDLDSAEQHLTEAVKLKPISPRPRNNLGRVLLRRSQLLEAAARAAEAKDKTDPGDVAIAIQFRRDAKQKRDDAIAQFEEAVRLEPILLEAHLNLGEVYLTLNELDKSEHHYQEIVKLQSASVKDRETIGNFSQAHFGLARIALARRNVDDAIAELQKAIELNPQNPGALQLLATQHFLRGEYQEGEKHLWSLLAMLPKAQRQSMAKQFVGQFKAAGKTKEEVRACNFFGWAFATSPQDNLLDPEAALAFAKHVAVDLTKEQDPAALDTLAAAQAANDKYKDAVQTAQAAIKLAKSQGNKPLADAISGRLQLYQKEKPYRCQLDGSDRP